MQEFIGLSIGDLETVVWETMSGTKEQDASSRSST